MKRKYSFAFQRSMMVRSSYARYVGDRARWVMLGDGGNRVME